MLRLQIFILFSCCLFLFSSCLNYSERIHFHDDGSGSAVIRLKFTDDEKNDYLPSNSSLKKMVNSFNERYQTNLTAESISDHLIIGFEFNNIDELNLVYSHLSSFLFSQYLEYLPVIHFSVKDGCMNRFFNDFSINRTDDNFYLSDKLQSFLSIYSFDSEVVSSENRFSTISGNKKSVMVHLEDMTIRGRDYQVSNQIRLK